MIKSLMRPSIRYLNAIGNCSGHTSAFGCRWEFLPVVYDKLTMVLLIAHRGSLTKVSSLRKMHTSIRHDEVEEEEPLDGMKRPHPFADRKT
jgi:hypothetical protein